MKILDKLIFKDLVPPFINGLFMFMTLVFAAAYLFPATDLLVKGVPFSTVAKLVLFSLPSVVTQTFPMAMLLSALLAFGRLSAEKELVAIFATGVSFPRAIRCVWIMGGIVSLCAFFWNDLVVPPASTAYGELKQKSMRNLLPADKPFSYTIETRDGRGIEEIVAIEGGADPKTNTLKRVTITRYSLEPERRGQPEAIIYSDRAIPVDDMGLQWKYYDGYFMVYSPDPKTGKIDDFVTTYFDELQTLPKGATIGKTFAEVLHIDSTDPNRLNFRELRAEIQRQRERGRDTRGKEVDLYGKLALPLASLIFGVMGAALGQSTQRGGSKAIGFGMAIFIAFLYWVFYNAMFVVGKNGGLPPILASFLADIVGVIAAIILMIRASR